MTESTFRSEEMTDEEIRKSDEDDAKEEAIFASILPEELARNAGMIIGICTDVEKYVFGATVEDVNAEVEEKFGGDPTTSISLRGTDPVSDMMVHEWFRKKLNPDC